MSGPNAGGAILSRGWTKLDCGLSDSSLWMLDHDAVRVWVYLLTKVDSDGNLRAAMPAMAHACRVTLERFEEIMRGFEAPDPYSRTPDNDGRRVARVEGGWSVLNYPLYRQQSQHKAGSHAGRQASYYQRKKEAEGLSRPTVSADAPTVSADAPTSLLTQMQMKMQRERKQEGSLPLPASLDSEEFRHAWADWLAYRRESKLTAWKPVTVKAKLAELAAWGAERAVAAIRRSIANGWQGIFDRDETPKPGRASAITSGLSDSDRAALRAMGTRHAGA